MRWFLFPLALLYGLIIQIRNKLFDLGLKKSKKYHVPVIAIGNITVGGTGKTPHTEYLIDWLKNSFSIATISRGYKRKTKGFLEVKSNSTSTEVGDEALQIKLKYPKIRVIVDEKRVHAIDTLLQEDVPPDLFLLDDAYQHRHVTPGLNILLIDYQRPITKDYLMPMGRLREPAHNCDRATIIIITKCPDQLTPIDFRIMQKELNAFPYQSLFFTTFRYGQIIPVFDKNSENSNIPVLKGMTILVLTGIANPVLIYKKLLDEGAIIEKAPFPDHHAFSKTDIEKVIQSFNSIKNANKAIICTEKDAVRIRTNPFNQLLQPIPIYYLPIKVAFLNNGQKEFQKVLNIYLAKYTRN